MSERAFLTEVENLFVAIEDWLEQRPDFVDFENQEGILTIDLPQDKQMIISRQLPLREVWLACPQGAFHFRHLDQQWRTQKGEELFAIIDQYLP